MTQMWSMVTVALALVGSVAGCAATGPVPAARIGSAEAAVREARGTGAERASEASPPPELTLARAAYERVHAGPAVQANTQGLHEARRALEEAEREFATNPASDDARHLAYLAHRKALVAEVEARAAIADTQRMQAEQALAEINARAALRDKLDARSKEDSEKARSARPPSSEP